MSTDLPAAPFYTVSYSDRVRDTLIRLGREAGQRGEGEAFLFVVREFHRRLCIYPQFGDPLTDLKAHAGHVRLGSVPPLTIRYAVYEEQRMVLVAALPVLLPRTRA